VKLLANVYSVIASILPTYYSQDCCTPVSVAVHKDVSFRVLKTKCSTPFSKKGIRRSILQDTVNLSSKEASV